MDDLVARIRGWVDEAPPITVDEVVGDATGPSPTHRRGRVVLGAAAAIVVLVVGTFAIIELTRDDERTTDGVATPTPDSVHSTPSEVPGLDAEITTEGLEPYLRLTLGPIEAGDGPWAHHTVRYENLTDRDIIVQDNKTAVVLGEELALKVMEDRCGATPRPNLPEEPVDRAELEAFVAGTPLDEFPTPFPLPCMAIGSPLRIPAGGFIDDGITLWRVHPDGIAPPPGEYLFSKPLTFSSTHPDGSEWGLPRSGTLEIVYRIDESAGAP